MEIRRSKEVDHERKVPIRSNTKRRDEVYSGRTGHVCVLRDENRGEVLKVSLEGEKLFKLKSEYKASGGVTASALVRASSTRERNLLLVRRR